MHLSIKAMTFASAIFWGAAVFLTTWWLIVLGQGGVNFFLVRVYPGYSVTPVGSLIGLLWGVVDGLIAGAIFAWLYNLLLPKKATTEGG